MDNQITGPVNVGFTQHFIDAMRCKNCVLRNTTCSLKENEEFCTQCMRIRTKKDCTFTRTITRPMTEFTLEEMQGNIIFSPRITDQVNILIRIPVKVPIFHKMNLLRIPNKVPIFHKMNLLRVHCESADEITIYLCSQKAMIRNNFQRNILQTI